MADLMCREDKKEKRIKKNAKTGEKNETVAECEKSAGISRSKRSLMSGVFVLTASNLLVKIIGLLFKIPMNYIVGDTGMGYFGSAYSIYTFLYMLSTSGLPVALAVMVSEQRAVGNVTAAKKVYRCALMIFSVIGLLTACLMLFASDFLSELIRSDKSAMAVAVTAPTMLFICISSALRGYFQGCGNMFQTAISQLIEAIGKLIIGICGAVYAVRMGYEIHIVAAYAVSGLTIGSLAGMIYLMFAKFMRGDRDLMPDDLKLDNTEIERAAILKRFVEISVPITISASVMSLTAMIDTAMIQRVLQHAGMEAEAAATLFGNYTSLAVPMFNLPPVLVYPIAYSIVPSVASARSAGLYEKAARAVELSLRTSVIIGLPCAAGLAVLSNPILRLFYRAESADMAAPLLAILAPSSFFVCILAVTNSVLQSSGEERRPVISMLCGAIVKCASSVILLRKFGIAGAPMSTFLCYLTVTAINLTFVVRCAGIKPDFEKAFIRPAVSAAICAASAFFGYMLFSHIMPDKAACIVSIIAAAATYSLSLYITGAVTTEDISEIKCGIKKDQNKKELR